MKKREKKTRKNKGNNDGTNNGNDNEEVFQDILESLEEKDKIARELLDTVYTSGGEWLNENYYKGWFWNFIGQYKW